MKRLLQKRQVQTRKFPWFRVNSNYQPNRREDHEYSKRNVGPQTLGARGSQRFLRLMHQQYHKYIGRSLADAVRHRLPKGNFIWAHRTGTGAVTAVGNIYFAYMAYKLAKKEGRDDVTAVPYGISVPHYFLVTFAIMLPIKLGGGDLNLAWSVGVAWCFVHALVAAIGAFIGPTMQRLTPRAAMLGTLAGVAITYIAMGAAFNAWNVAWLSMVSFGIIFVGWLANVQFPGKIPAGLVAVIIGIIFGWASGYMKVGALNDAITNAAIAIPLPQIRLLLEGLPQVTPYLVTAIPLAIYLFLESLNNVESALAGGDRYDTREAMLAAAGGTLVASLFSSPFPTLIYIGHPGWKSVGSRVGYSWLTGVTMFLLGVLGLLGILSAIIPVVAILPILVYIGMLITSQAFNASPKRHAPAVAIAIVPWIADYVTTQVNNALGAAGTNAATL